MKKITLGFETYTETLDKETGEMVKSGGGDPVSIKQTHLCITGTTRSGKSELVKALIERARDPSIKILILDAKTNARDYAGFYADITPYLAKQMDSFMIKDLLESTKGIPLKRELPELIRIVEVSEDWDEMYSVAKDKLDRSRPGWVKDTLTILVKLFEGLLEEIGKYKFTSKLELPNDINVMDISNMSDQLQQIIVSSVIRYVLKHMQNVRIVIDEAHRFIPQNSRAACSNDIVKLAREGLANNNMLWVADQTITGIDKDLLKQMQIWILGRQGELNEAQRIVKQIPRAKSLGINVDIVQTLRLGEFVVVTPNGSKTIYAQPIWLSKANAIHVAVGNITADDVKQLQFKKGDDDMEWRKKYESQKLKFEKREREQEQIIKGLEKRIRDLDKRMKRLDEKTRSKPKENEVVHVAISETAKAKDTVAQNQTLLEEEVIELPESITVEVEQPALTIIIKRPPLTLTDSTILGKVSLLYSEGHFQDDTWLSIKDVGVGFVRHAWAIPRGSNMSSALNQMVQWGYLTKQINGKKHEYKTKLNHEEAEDMGLLKTKIAE